MPERIKAKDVIVGDVVVIHVGGDAARVDGPHAVLGAKWVQAGSHAEPNAARTGARWELYTDTGVVEVWEDDEVYRL
jgi:hypothetical protein